MKGGITFTQVFVIILEYITWKALIAQLGERQTEDLKVVGSIPTQGNILHTWLSITIIHISKVKQ